MANEKRLIDANALQFEPDENCIANGVLIWGGRSGSKTMTTVLHALKVMINNAPTVKSVEVERYIELLEQYDKLFLEYHELRDNFISYVCGGIPNPSPFCLNMRRGCCDSHGWCKNDDKCQGFNPAEVILNGAKMDGDGNA